MKTELLNKPARHLRIDSSGLLLMCLTFMLGVGAYVLTKPSLPQSAHVNYLIVDLDYRVFGCILCLLLVQLTAFSVIGSVIIPVLDFIFGFFVSVSLATIIPADKLNVIDNLLEKADTLIIGGGMAYTFLKAQGKEIGISMLDETKLDYCNEMMAKAEKLGKKILLPVDAVTIKEFPNPIDAPVETLIVDSDNMPADREGCDIGPKTR